MKRLILLIIVALVAVALPAHATTHRVDVAGGGEYEDIWGALVVAEEGDTILVAPGTYSGGGNVNIDPEGVNIVFLAEGDGSLPVIIDCGNEHRGFYLQNGEDATTVIRGFTIINGNEPSASGLNCTSTSPTVENCTFENCYSGINGGALNLYNSQAVISSCVFRANIADRRGGAVYAYLGGPQFTSCLFEGNTIVDPSQPDHTGGALYLNSCAAVIANCTIVGNALDQIDIKGSASDVIIMNSIIAFSEAGVGVAASGTDYGAVSHSIIFGNAAGDSLECDHTANIFLDPLFCDDTSDDYTLCDDSFALDYNNLYHELIGAYGMGCGPCGSPVEASSWGRVKALYR